MVYASQFSEQVSDAEGFCWQVNNFKSNWHELIIKKNKELDRLHEIYVNLIKNSEEAFLERPTGFCFVPPFGPAIPVIETLMLAFDILDKLLTIAKQHS